MRAELSNVTTEDSYTPANTLRLPNTRRITIQVANAAIRYQLDESADGKGQWTDEGFLAPSIGSLTRICSGMRIRSALAGAAAQVTLELLDEDGADSLSPFTSRVASDGGVDTVIPGLELSYKEYTAPVEVTATAEASANEIVAAGEITFDGSTAVWIEFYVPRVDFSSQVLRLCIFDGANSIGFHEFGNNSVAGFTMGTLLRRRLTPAAAVKTYSVRGYLAAGAGSVFVRAGAGGAGAFLPGYIRIAAA